MVDRKQQHPLANCPLEQRQYYSFSFCHGVPAAPVPLLPSSPSSSSSSQAPLSPPQLLASLSLSLYLFPLALPPSMTATQSAVLSLSRTSHPPFALTEHGIAPRYTKTLPTTLISTTAAWHLNIPPRSTSLSGVSDCPRRHKALPAITMQFPKLPNPHRRKHSKSLSTPSWPLSRVSGLSPVFSGEHEQPHNLLDGNGCLEPTHKAAATAVAAAPEHTTNGNGHIEISPTPSLRTLAQSVPTVDDVATSAFFVVSQTMQGRGLPNLKLVVPGGQAVYCWREIVEAACPSFIDGEYREWKDTVLDERTSLF